MGEETMPRFYLRCFLSMLGLMLAIPAAHAGEDFITRDEFNLFRAEFEKFRAENEKLKQQNAQLVKAMENVATSLQHPHAPLASKLETYLAPAPPVAASKDDVDAVRSGTTKFLIGGWSDAGFEDRSGENSTFTASFHPVFLWRLSDRISFESDFGFATIDYHVDDHLTLEVGRFLTPVGNFMRTQRPSWINKFPDRPFALQETGGLVPELSLGAMAEGGFNAGPTKFNYAAFIANGPELNSGSAQNFGTLSFGGGADSNRNKALGGRIGFLPIPELELGASMEMARVGRHRSQQAGVDARLLAADLNYCKTFDAIKGTVDVRAEWVWSNVGDATYTVNGDDVLFNNNHRDGGYAQFSYRPTQINQKWVKNLEIALRYDRIDNPEMTPDTPEDALVQRTDRDRWTFGLNYWLGPSTLLKFAYEKDTRDDHALLFQFALGF
jgi:hypothetical protein